MEENPFNLEEIQFEIEGNASKIEEDSSKMVETPAKMVETPVNMVETPVKMVETPSKMVETPSKMVDTPSKMVETPSKIKDNKSNIEETNLSTEGKLFKMEERIETCQFCDVSTDVRYNCDDCNLLLCKVCNDKIHSKISSVVEHKVTQIHTDTDNSTQQDEILDLKRISCSNHHEQTCFAICQNCDKSICSSCIVRSENEESLNKIYLDKLQSLKDFQAKVDQDLLLFSNHAEHLWNIKEERLENYNKIKQQILSKEEEMKDKIADQAFSLIKQLDDWWSPQNAEISEEQEIMSEAENDLKQRKNIIEEALQSEKRESIMTAADLVIKELPKGSFKEIKTANQVKFSTEKSTNNLGSLLEIPRLKIVKSFDCDVTSDLNILEEDVMIGYNSSKKEMKQYVLINNKCYYTNCIENTSIWDATVTNNGKVLITNFNTQDTNIYEITGNKTKIYTSMRPLVPIGIHATKDGKMIVGYIENNNPAAIESERGIMILDENKTIIQKINGMHYNGERLFNFPHSITTNINGDICIIDSTNTNWEGRVIALTENGKFRWIYDGLPQTRLTKKLKPISITTISTGQLLIMNVQSGTIHMVSMDGLFMTFLGKTDGVGNALGITSHHEKIFVGCHGKLHILKDSVLSSQQSETSSLKQMPTVPVIKIKKEHVSTSAAKDKLKLKA